MKTSRQRRGMLFVLSSPSGGGKSTILEAVLKRAEGIRYSVSVTSRAPRGAERAGKSYTFVSREEFQRRIEAGEFLEYAEVHGHLYGTPRATVEEMLDQGLDCSLDIDVQGGLQIKRRFPEAELIFIMPPSIEVLESRLRRRASDSNEEIRIRLKNAPGEMARSTEYDHIVVNENLEQAIQEVETIIDARREARNQHSGPG